MAGSPPANAPETDRSALEADWRWQLARRAAAGSALYRATRLRDILLYIVRQAIFSPEEPIHESEIAHRVLGRRSDFNPLEDNIVRVQMAHLRKKLDQYFSGEGKDEETVITVALGSYRPVFSPRPRPASDELAGSPAERSQPPAAGQEDQSRLSIPAQSRLWERWVLLALLAAALAGCVALWLHARSLQAQLANVDNAVTPWKNQPDLAALWSQFTDSDRETDIVLSDDSLLLIEQIQKQEIPFDGYLNRSYLSSAPPQAMGADARYLQGLIATKSLGNVSEFKLANRLLGLDPTDQQLHVYSARQYMPALAKQDNVILIGGRISNPWAALYEGRLNFVEETTFEGYGKTRVVNRSPGPGEAPIYFSSDSEGYCVLAFLPNPGPSGKVLLIEGTSGEATEAAGDFLFSERFSAFLKGLHDQRMPYFEILLKTSQVRGTPMTVNIQAYRAYSDNR